MLDDMSKQFQTFAELQVYSNSQHEIIAKLNARINELEQKEQHLQKLLTDNSIVVGSADSIKDMFMQCEDPEGIARMQLKILRDHSLKGELSIEETKRVEIYTKILDSVEAKKKDRMKDISKDVKTEDLLQLVSGEHDGSIRS